MLFRHEVKRHLAMIKLYGPLLLRAATRFCRLPPGRLEPLDRAMDVDQLYFAKRAEALGPIFKLICRGRYTTCLVGPSARANYCLPMRTSFLAGPLNFEACFQKALSAR